MQKEHGNKTNYYSMHSDLQIKLFLGLASKRPLNLCKQSEGYNFRRAQNLNAA